MLDGSVHTRFTQVSIQHPLSRETLGIQQFIKHDSRLSVCCHRKGFLKSFSSKQ